MKIKDTFVKLKTWLAGLSFKTGILMACICLICYVLAFAQIALPIANNIKVALWIIFYGLAKTFQYASVIVMGKEGFKRLKSSIIRSKS